MHAAREKGTCGQHHRARFEAHTDLGNNAGDFVTLKNQVIHRLLKNAQVWMVFKPRAYCLAIQDTIRLCTRRAHGRTFA